MAFNSVSEILEHFRQLNAKLVIFKILSANDNSKQQIYFGGNFEVIRLLPYENLHPCPGGKRPNFKADLNFYWIDEIGKVEQASQTKLILYPDYPEVRLSGFLQGCKIAPRKLLQPLSRAERQQRTDTPRVLFLGISDDSRVYGYLSAWSDHIAQEAIHLRDNGTAQPVASVFYELPLDRVRKPDNRLLLLQHLREVYEHGWIEAFKLDTCGIKKPYLKKVPPQAGGYTLEGMLGIIPNGNAGPDFLGWEVKAHSRTNNRITLMTPEPTIGLYAKNFQQFMFNYGRRTSDNRYDFTGTHKANEFCKTSGLIMRLDGYDSDKEIISNPDGGVYVYDKNENLVAGWTFIDLMNLWKLKHNKTVFVPYEKETSVLTHFRYGPVVTTAEGADFNQYIRAIANKVVIYDPGVKITQVQGKKGIRWKPKKRNQIRVSISNITSIYDKIQIEDLSEQSTIT